MQPSDLQLLKAFGRLPEVSLSEVSHDSPSRSLHQVDREILDGRTCGHPDAPDPEIASHDDPEKLASQLSMDPEVCAGLISAHYRMMQSFRERLLDDSPQRVSRSFPVGCHDDLKSPIFDHKGRNAATFFVDRDTFPSHYTRPVQTKELERISSAKVWRWSLEEILDLWSGKSMLDVAVALMVESFRVRGAAMIEVFTGPSGKHNIHIRAKDIPGSTIGLGWYNNGTCGDHVDNHIDSTWRPGLFGTARLLTHECGHNWNLEHTFSGQNRHHGVMSYDAPDDGYFYGFSTGESPYVLPRDPALRQLDSYLISTDPVPLKGVTAPVKPPVANPPEDSADVLVARFRDGGNTYEVIRKGSKSHDDDILIWS